MARTSRPKHGRGEWVAVLLVCAIVALVAGAMPAIATFDVPTASGPSSTVVFNARTLPTPSGLACTWTDATTETISWTGVGATYSWMDGFQLKRSTNGGAYSNQGSAITPYSATSTTDTPATPASNSYTYKLYSNASTNWVSPDSAASPASTACVGAISTAHNAAAATAQLSSPEQVVFDSSGNMFIADTGNHCIREIPVASGTNYNVAMTAGYIHTIAGTCGTSGATGNGGAATSATLNQPESVAVDSSGNVYIADRSNNAVRKVTTGGTISLFAGTMSTSGNTGDTGAATSAKLTSPVGVAVDGNGNVFISDRANSVCRVRVVKPTDSKIYAAAGNGTCGNNGDGSAGGAASQQLNHAQQLANDPSNTNRMWIADTSNHEIRRIDCASNCTAANTTPTYTLTTVIGNSASGDGDAVVVGGSVLNSPFGVYVNSAGDIFIADSTNNKIKEAPAATNTYFNISMTAGKIYTIAGSGSTTNNGEGYPEKLSGLNNPYSVALYGGTVYMTDTGHHMIRKISANYNLIAAAGIGTSGTAGNGTLPYSSAVLNPSGIAVDSSGNVYIADPSDNRIRKWYAGTSEVATIAGTGSSGSAGDGSAATAANLSGPAGVAVDSSGNVYVADTTSCKIRKVTVATGVISTVAGTGTCGISGDTGAATSAKISTDYGVAVDGSGNLYIADYANCRVRLVLASNGNIYTIDGNGTCDNAATHVNFPVGIAVDSSKNVYVADTTNGRIKKLTCTAPCTATPPSYTASTIAGPYAAPNMVATDGTYVYFDSNTGGVNWILKEDVSGITGATLTLSAGTYGYSGDGGPVYAAKVQGLSGIGLNSGGDIYFTQNSDKVLRKIVGPI